jgi:hypothetical protein
VEEALRFGCLPLVASERSHAGRVDLLDAYVETYLGPKRHLRKRIDLAVGCADAAVVVEGADS